MHILPPIAAALIAAGGVSHASAQEAAPKSQQAPAAEPMPHPVDCTFTDAVICEAGSSCEPSETLGEVALPARFLIHFEKRLIATVNTDGLPHVSTIGVFAESGDNLILQGIGGATGWMIQGSTSDERASFTVASHHTVLTAFGTCKPAEE